MVDFRDLSTGNPVSWSWDFGDGSYSSLQNPSHTYTSAGSCSVTLSVKNKDYGGNLRIQDAIVATRIINLTFGSNYFTHSIFQSVGQATLKSGVIHPNN
ncbi:PKD domain-containing protein [Methanospirillum sp.]|uniref:PKD domain-containing protein n=1 Tax=Methanospirillum sp. TaxID=45200 RepID=UPI00345D8E7C